ncbi:XkdQ/YqbQ family protein [Methanobacterium sp.]|uniref:XkdQ/YqbQ family protein n=1 Tax=Methanobacterium sp. TaxID=2164 RepID=UPI003C7614EE
MNTQIYIGSESIQYSDLTITNSYVAADTIQFTTHEHIEDMSIVHIIGDHHPFGGFVLKRPESSEGDYNYTGIDFSRLLNGKIFNSYYNKTISQIAINLLEKRGMRTGGIQKTTKKHSKLIFKSKKAIDVCHQLANLESNTEFFINSDGVAVLRKIPEKQEGYLFAHPSVFDYDLTYDPTDIITAIMVYGENDKKLYNYKNMELIAKYGWMTDIIEDSSLKTQSAAKAAALKEWKEKAKVEFSGSLTFPILKYMRAGLKCTFIPPEWSKNGIKSYFVQQVKTIINKNTREQQIDLVSGKPAPPSEWIYEAPSSSSSSPSGGSGTVAEKAKALGSPRACRRWIDANVPYKFYYNHKAGHSPEYIVRNPSIGANCWDQSDLFVAMCKALGFKAKRVCGKICNGYRHCNAEVYIDGRWIVADCTCSHLNRLV